MQENGGIGFPTGDQLNKRPLEEDRQAEPVSKTDDDDVLVVIENDRSKVGGENNHNLKKDAVDTDNNEAEVVKPKDIHDGFIIDANNSVKKSDELIQKTESIKRQENFLNYEADEDKIKLFKENKTKFDDEITAQIAAIDLLLITSFHSKDDIKLYKLLSLKKDELNGILNPETANETGFALAINDEKLRNQAPNNEPDPTSVINNEESKKIQAKIDHPKNIQNALEKETDLNAQLLEVTKEIDDLNNIDINLSSTSGEVNLTSKRDLTEGEKKTLESLKVDYNKLIDEFKPLRKIADELLDFEIKTYGRNDIDENISLLFRRIPNDRDKYNIKNSEEDIKTKETNENEEEIPGQNNQEIDIQDELTETEIKVLNEIIEKTEELRNNQKTLIELINAIDSSKNDPNLFDIHSKSFDSYYISVMKGAEELITSDQISDELRKNPLIKAEIDGFEKIVANIKDLNAEKLLLIISNSFLKDVMAATSTEEQNTKLDDLVTSGELTKEEVERTKTALESTFNKAGIALDAFIAMNKDASLETFLAFLRNPTGVSGRGEAGSSYSHNEEAVDNSEVVDLAVFRDKFDNHEKVAKSLVDSLDKINPDWKVTNNDLINSVKDSDGYNNPQATKELLIKLFTELILDTDSVKSKENKDLFRLHFTTALFGGSTPKAMDGDCLVFIVSKLQNDGENLDTLWNIKSSDN
jgi:hypothetical protein